MCGAEVAANLARHRNGSRCRSGVLCQTVLVADSSAVLRNPSVDDMDWPQAQRDRFHRNGDDRKGF